MPSAEDEQLDAELDDSEGAMAQMTIESPPPATSPEVDVESGIVEDTVMETETKVTSGLDEQMEILEEQERIVQRTEAITVPGPTDALPFIVDTVGDRSLAPPATAIAPLIRSHSPTPSDSSEEVILFRGRHDVVTVRDETEAPTHQPSFTPTNKSHVADALLDALDDASAAPRENASSQVAASAEGTWASQAPKWREEEPKQWIHANGEKSKTQRSYPPVQETGSRKSKSARKRNNRQMRLQEDLEEELLQDYIENMDQEEMEAMRVMAENGGDSWDSTDEEIDDKEDEEDDEEVDFIINASDLDSSYDEDEDEDMDEEDETGDDSDLESDIEAAEREMWEDEEDLRQRRQDAMTDEEIARILAKQESYGMGSDELLLFDGGFAEGDEFGDLDAARVGLPAFITRAAKGKNKRGTPKGGRRGGRKSDHYPDASLMADVLEQDPYGGFDIMDMDRPSLRPKKKGRKSAGALPEELAGLSDEELIAEITNSWAADRDKKKAKKAEREELRALGLLGGGKKKGNKFKPDLSTRYMEGMTMEQIKIELRDFLEEDDFSSKHFPPMLATDRKILHQIAAHFNLKSKSVGSGKNRAPVLIKTSRTIEWSDEHFAPVHDMIRKGFFKNSQMRGKAPRGGRNAQIASENRRKRKGGGMGDAVSYRNGEVVGASAPEIGESNFGRRLMEKMGWEKGMSLGKHGAGLLVPVAAVIKSGKAGLG